jgi:Arc/MetJ-type ribon-helix-helix transcriptional regulator
MRIITVNLPESYLKAIDHLVGETGIYPSRSELVRVAVREFLIKELNTAQSFTQLQPSIFKEMNVSPKSTMLSSLSHQSDKDIDDALGQD